MYEIENIIKIIIIRKNVPPYPGSKAIEITYPNKIKTKNTIPIKKNDFALFLEI